MKLRIASDFHLEFMSPHQYQLKPFANSYTFLPYQPEDKDTVLLLAGDIVCANRLHEWADFFTEINDRFLEVFMVAGNHEHYNFDFFKTIETIRTFLESYPKITLLDSEIGMVEDIAIFGATMWTDFNYGVSPDHNAISYAKRGMSDFIGAIYKEEPSGPRKKLDPLDTIDEFSYSEVKLAQFAVNPWLKDFKKVIMTHHGLSLKSLSSKFAGSPLNPAFLSDRDDIILNVNPALYIHGHIHQNMSYDIGTTQVIVNPYGYQYENPNYIPSLIVEL